LIVRALGQALPLDVPHDVFSSQRIDDGTLLLLEHLPPGQPRRVLDLGCGYGALGLPVAARFPHADCVLVDRDLLAVAASVHNARSLKLGNVLALPGLGYRGMAGERFDWVLCNVPARIGEEAVRYLIEGGLALGAEVRVVVIRDLSPIVESLGLESVIHLARGPRHDVFAFPPRPAPAFDLDRDDVYARDQTAFSGLSFSRPFDASEDPSHLPGLALLADALPRKPPASALVFRAGYGPLPLALKALHPQCTVVAQERDLLDLAFLGKNSARLRLSVEARPSLFPGEAAAGRKFALICGELSSPAGPAVALRELSEAGSLLEEGGDALVLASEKQLHEWVPKSGRATILLRREGACVLRISRPRG
jgi:16S rRNA G1207 methylase RsmC